MTQAKREAIQQAAQQIQAEKVAAIEIKNEELDKLREHVEKYVMVQPDDHTVCWRVLYDCMTDPLICALHPPLHLTQGEGASPAVTPRG